MPTSVYSSPFPSLDHTFDDKQHLLRTADELLDQVERNFEDFLWRDKGQVDSTQWDLVKEREDVRVYHDRRPGGGTGNMKMHQLLTTGTILSTLNDAMYGELNHTTEAMRIKTEYLDDTFLDSAVLETILEPTVDDPFQSTTVRWFVKGIPLLARAVFNHADNVVLESTGMRQLSNGERIGFRLVHSISFAKTPRLPSYDRINASICTIYREVTPKTVQLFMTSFFEINETFMLPVLIKSTADALISVWKVTKCAQMKKLTWLVEQKATFSQLAEAGGRSSIVSDGCSVCGSKGRSTRKGIKSACAACSQYTCKSCRVKRDLCVFSPDRQLIKHQTRFCLHCLTVANKLDAAVIARDQALGREEASSDHYSEMAAAIQGAMGKSSGPTEPSIHLTGRGNSGGYRGEWSSSSSSAASPSKSSRR